MEAEFRDDEFEDLSNRVARSVRRNCPPWLRQRADDIAQDVLLKLLKSKRRADGDKTFTPAYLEMAVSGAVVDEIRRACRRKEDPVPDVDTVGRPAQGGSDPESRSWSREIVRGLVDCLRRLLRTRRLAVTLYLSGCTVPEAAARLHWGVHRTENLVYRGLADLRRCLSRKGLQP